MDPVLIGYNNLLDAATLTPGIGSWSANAPLANLKDPVVSVAARSTDALAASTKFEVDLGSAQTVGLVALSGVNLTSAATIRVRGSTATNAGGTVVYNGSAINVWPTGTDAALLARHNRWTPIVKVTATSARYWLIEITDTANPDGYVQLGRVFLGPVVQPTWNMSYGARLRWVNRNVRDETESGVLYTSRRPAYRETVFALDHLTRAEAITSLHDLHLLTAESPEVVLLFDPASTDTTRLRESYLGELHDFDPLGYASPERYSSGFVIREKL